MLAWVVERKLQPHVVRCSDRWLGLKKG